MPATTYVLITATGTLVSHSAARTSASQIDERFSPRTIRNANRITSGRIAAASSSAYALRLYRSRKKYGLATKSTAAIRLSRRGSHSCARWKLQTPAAVSASHTNIPGTALHGNMRDSSAPRFHEIGG